MRGYARPMPRVVVASAVLCLAVAACGGESDPQASPSASPSATALSKAEYVAKVNAICARVEADAQNVPEPKTADDYLSVVQTFISTIETAQAELRALTPPAADAAEVEAKFLAANDQQALALKVALPALQAAAQSDDTAAAEKAFGEAVTAAETTDEQDEFATSYGLTSCV